MEFPNVGAFKCHNRIFQYDILEYKCDDINTDVSASQMAIHIFSKCEIINTPRWIYITEQPI